MKFETRGDMREFRGFNNSTNKRVLNVLLSNYLRFQKIIVCRVTAVKFIVNDGESYCNDLKHKKL